ncbi:MAG TPA: tetratricopeptide repeat protein [Steroidobacteraceae bacterium]|nr:tetratricopeptide repeat protein [Steroidobacteraceae bacterium]
MPIRHLAYMAALATFSWSTAVAAPACQLQQLGLLPVEMQGLRPTISTKINGVEARFILDTGSFYSTMWRDAADRFHLPVGSLANGAFYVQGLGGSEKGQVATVDKFEFLGVPLRKVQFIVIDQGGGSDVAGLLGQNLLRIADMEYDLSAGNVRFFKPVGCKDRPLAYWAVSTPYSYVELRSMDVYEPHLRADVMINGKRMTAWFDTGAARSWLSLEAAKRAGITPSSPGVQFLGITYSIGPAPSKAWIAPVDSFQVGGEKVTHTHLLVGEFHARDPEGYETRGFPDMLLGVDFFLSHRIYVAYSQRKLYFTYNGGPLFNLNLPEFAAGAGTARSGSDATSHANATAGEPPESDAPTDADGFKRRGMAYASMREFDRAVADLTRACELAPNDAGNRIARGEVYVQEGQFSSALQDFDAAIKLQPDDIRAHLARAELLHSHPDADQSAAGSEVKSDLDAVSRLSAPAASVRLELSSLYGEVGDYSDSIAQVDQWLDNHRLLADQATGLNERCWQRAVANRDLHDALQDCNRALALRPRAEASTGSLIRRDVAPQNPAILDTRGLVYVRLGNFNDAIRDYDSALSINSNMPTSLYGRGLAELRLGDKERGQADIAAAEKLAAGIAKRFARMGLAP